MALTTAAVLVSLVGAGAAPAADRFVKPAGAGASCLQTAPCTLAVALAASLDGDRVFAAAGTYTGTGSQVVQLNRSVELLGGWDGAATGDARRDPVAHVSTLDGENARRVLTISAGTPIVDGFTITRGNATGLAAGCPSGEGTAAGCGGGVLVTRAYATLSRNTIVANVAHTAVPANRVAYGGGIAALEGSGMTVVGCVITGNVAAVAGRGSGGGVALSRCDGARLEGNRIADNTAAAGAGATGRGGGISMDEGMGSFLEKNVIRDNGAAPSGRPTGNQLYLLRALAYLSSNCVLGSLPPDAAVFDEASPILQKSLFLQTAAGWAVVCSGGELGPLQASHSVFAGGGSGVLRVSGGSQLPTIATLLHCTIAGNGSGTGVQTSGSATVQLSNCIVAGHGVGIAPGAPPFTMVLPDTTLFWNNTSDGLRGDAPLDGDPLFANAPAGDFHILPGSAAVGAARGHDNDVDIDGDVRPGTGGSDVGADELAVRAFDFGTASSPVAPGHLQVTPATAYAQASGFGWLSGALDARDRRVGGDLQRDLVFTPLATFAVDVPPGRYRVTLMLGDAAAAHGQMGVFLEGLQVASVTTAANEFKTVTVEAAVVDEQLTVLLDDLGGADRNVVVNALAVDRALPVRADLGTSGSPVADGYSRLTHASAYTQAAGSGWLGGAISSRDRATADPLRRDLAFTPRGLLGFHLVNGLYDVTLVQGDAAGRHDLMEAQVQGRALAPLSTAANQFATRTCRTCVADQELRVALVDRGGSDPNVVLNAVEVAAVRPPRFDFGTSGSPVAAGFTQVTHATAYAPTLGHGWVSGTIGSRDRAVGGDRDRDLNLTVDGTFVVDVLNGRYLVTVTVGDAAAAHDAIGISLEGALVDTVATPKNRFVTRSFTVLVADGQLTLRLQDLGGVDPFAVITGLEIR